MYYRQWDMNTIVRHIMELEAKGEPIHSSYIRNVVIRLIRSLSVIMIPGFITPPVDDSIPGMLQFGQPVLNNSHLLCKPQTVNLFTRISYGRIHVQRPLYDRGSIPALGYRPQ